MAALPRPPRPTAESQDAESATPPTARALLRALVSAQIRYQQTANSQLGNPHAGRAAQGAHSSSFAANAIR